MPQTQPGKFETTTCSRCGGSGHYSYCQRFGTTCFKCGGAKMVYTKRGKVAHDYFEALLSKPAADLVAGLKVRADIVTMGGAVGSQWMTVVAVRLLLGTMDIELDGLMMTGVPRDRVFRVAATADEKKAARDAALAFQSTLTKAGTPRQRASRLAIPSEHMVEAQP